MALAQEQAAAAAGRAMVTADDEEGHAGLAPMLLAEAASVVLMAVAVLGDQTDPETGSAALSAHGAAVAGLLEAVCVCASYCSCPTPHAHAPS